MTTPTTHEDGTPRRRVSDKWVASYARNHQGYFISELALDLRDARAQVADLTRQLEERTAERDEARLGISERTQGGGVATIPRQDLNNMLAERETLKARAFKAETTLRDHEQRGGQVTDEMVERACEAFTCRTLDCEPAGSLKLCEEAGLIDDVGGLRADMRVALESARPSLDPAPDTTTPQDGLCDRGTVAEAADGRAQRRKATIRECVTWLHARAALMSDSHATSILNSAALHLGETLGAAAIRARNEEGRE